MSPETCLVHCFNSPYIVLETQIFIGCQNAADQLCWYVPLLKGRVSALDTMNGLREEGTKCW